MGNPLRLLWGWVRYHTTDPAVGWQCSHVAKHGGCCQRWAGHFGRHKHFGDL